jgi:hypothetical protein
MLDARRAALAHLIDHAPLFPPASLPMPDALDEDRRARADENAWLLARLVWPASRLGELEGEDRGLSVLLDGPYSGDARAQAVETRWEFGLEGLAGEAYVELPLSDELEERVARLADRRLRAKVRCGGAVVPSVEELARFVRACRRHGVVFKATAGLHHALPTGGEHGLLNLLAAAVFGDEDAALAEADPAAFRFDAGTFRWRDRAVDAVEVGRVRRELFATVGSCSFAEPVDELRSLGLL